MIEFRLANGGELAVNPAMVSHVEKDLDYKCVLRVGGVEYSLAENYYKVLEKLDASTQNSRF